MERFCAVIPAAGDGSRMEGELKKQYIKLFERPLVCYSIESFKKVGVTQIILVVPKEDIDFCKEMLKEHSHSDVTVTAGGDSRGESVYNGLLLADREFCFIHDGARPLIDQDLIRRCRDGVLKNGSAVAAVPSKDTIKISDDGQLIIDTPSRSRVYSVQTPQTFPTDVIRQAYKKALDDGGIKRVSDDASVLEMYGKKVFLAKGSYKNIKITEPTDLVVAEVLLAEEGNTDTL